MTAVGLDALAGSLWALGPTYAFHRRLIPGALEPMSRQDSALIWSRVQVLDKVERGVS